MIDITPVVKLLAIVIATVVTCVLVPYLKTRLDSTRLAELQSWVKIAVQAAEQIFKESGKGADKKAYVVAFLESKGFTLDVGSVDAMIEAAVLELHEIQDSLLW